MQTGDVKTKAVVTRAVPYNESDMIVTLVSLDLGRITATAKGCLKPKAKLRYAAEPLNFGDYLLRASNGRYIIAECSQIDSFSSVTADLSAYYAASLVLEVLQKLSNEAQPQLMLAALKALAALAYDGAVASDVIRDYLLDALFLNGSGLDFAHCNVCKCDITDEAYFRESDGVVCRHCNAFDAIAVDALSRSYLAKENSDVPSALKQRANMLLSDIVYILLGVRIGAHYFTE